MVPIEMGIKHNDDEDECFYSFAIAHRRTDYARTWFDVIDAPIIDHMTGNDHLYESDLVDKVLKFTLPNPAADLYFSVNSYYENMIPRAECTGDERP